MLLHSHLWKNIDNKKLLMLSISHNDAVSKNVENINIEKEVSKC
jgi:hypothetical protein